MEAILAIGLLWLIAKAGGEAADAFEAAWQRTHGRHMNSLANSHPDMPDATRRAVAHGRTALGAATFLPATARGWRRGWHEARKDYGQTRDDHKQWIDDQRAARKAARRAKYAAARPPLMATPDPAPTAPAPAAVPAQRRVIPGPPPATAPDPTPTRPRTPDPTPTPDPRPDPDAGGTPGQDTPAPDSDHAARLASLGFTDPDSNSPRPPADKDSGNSAGEQSGGNMSEVPTGEITGYVSANNALQQFSDLANQCLGAADQIAASMQGAGVDSDTLSDISMISEAAASLSAAAVNALNNHTQRHSNLHEAHVTAPDGGAEKGYYTNA